MSCVACPCQSQQAYTQCCQPFHQGHKIPATAEQLMRSRYSAYVLKHLAYIVDTTVPVQQQHLDQQAISAWSAETVWDGLEILKHHAKLGKHHAQVEFKAYFQTPQGRQYHQELSTFVKIGARWYFLDPTLDLVFTMKQPCLCGSGRKYKQCCATYLSSF